MRVAKGPVRYRNRCAGGVLLAGAVLGMVNAAHAEFVGPWISVDVSTGSTSRQAASITTGVTAGVGPYGGLDTTGFRVKLERTRSWYSSVVSSPRAYRSSNNRLAWDPERP